MTSTPGHRVDTRGVVRVANQLELGVKVDAGSAAPLLLKAAGDIDALRARVAALARVGTPIPDPPEPEPTPSAVEHPLSVALGPGWRWLPEHVSQTVVLLHQSGFYVVVSESFLRVAPTDTTAIVAFVMNYAVGEGKVGEHAIVVTNKACADGKPNVYARAEPVQRKP